MDEGRLFFRQNVWSVAPHNGPLIFFITAMLTKFRTLLICLAVLAVGAVQVFGVQAGYLCGCTGQKSSQASCLTEVCHPQKGHEGGCGTATSKSASAKLGHDDNVPCGNDHKHSEVRESLVVTNFPSVSALPAVVLFDLPPAFQVPDYTMLVMASLPGMECPDPPEYGSPPMPLLVARTIVMRV